MNDAAAPRYLLDTDRASDLLRTRGAKRDALTTRMAAAGDARFALCVVALQEQTRGVLSELKGAKRTADVTAGYAALQSLVAFYHARPVLPFDEDAAERLARLGPGAAGIGVRDRRIAAIALVHGCTLLTRNGKHFGKVPGLAHEDWTAPLS